MRKVSGLRVLVGISGGIDSAVSAWKLLQEGYEVEGVFMKNWSSTKGLKYDECPWLQDRQDALRVAAFLKIPLHTLDFEKEYETAVLDYFFESYAKGLTPNPDVMCNKEIKFKLLYNWAMGQGFDFLATGHYARIGRAKGIGYRVEGVGESKIKNQKSKIDYTLTPIPYTLERSVDEFKDQTYFIYNIKTEQLPHLLFPIGGMVKKDVRKLAQEIGLPNADKKESMGLCFVGKIRLKDFLEQKVKLVPGDIVDTSGKVLGKHGGLPNYTIGQREGIAVGGGKPLYVVKKDLVKNILIVTDDPNDPLLEVVSVEIADVNWIVPMVATPPSLPFVRGGIERVSMVKETNNIISPPYEGGVRGGFVGRVRHQGELQKLNLEDLGNGHYRVTFDRPQKAVASGQSLVLYDGKVCLGGGVIV